MYPVLHLPSGGFPQKNQYPQGIHCAFITCLQQALENSVSRIMDIDVTVDPAHLTRVITDAGERQPLLAKAAIFNAQGTKILEAGTAINAAIYERLMAHKLQLPLEQSLTAKNLLNGGALRESMEVLLDVEPFYARMTASGQQRTLFLEVLEKLPLPEPVAFQLSVVRDARPVLFRNALGAAWTMLWLYHRRTATRYDLSMAASAGLLHDMGMLHLSPALMDRRAELSRDERRQLYIHPVVGRMLLERHHQYSSEVLRAVVEHHEYLDGSGYPQNLMGERISPMGRALALSSVVVSLLGDRHRGGELRLAVLLRMNQHRYAPELIRHFMGLLRPEEDPRSAAVDALDEPLEALHAAYRIASDWPRQATGFEGVTPERLAAMQAVTRQVDLFCRTLVSAGVSPGQLAALGDVSGDAMLMRELTLLAREAAWQLRSLSRQARRSWRGGADGIYPRLLLHWLESAEGLSQRTLPASLDRRSDDTPSLTEA